MHQELHSHEWCITTKHLGGHQKMYQREIDFWVMVHSADSAIHSHDHACILISCLSAQTLGEQCL